MVRSNWRVRRAARLAGTLLLLGSVSACIPQHGDPGPPSAVIAATPATTGPAPLIVHFDGSASVGPAAGQPVSGYWWDFGDGTSPETAPVVDHTFAEAGSYTVTLTTRSDFSPFPGSSSVVITVTAVG